MATPPTARRPAPFRSNRVPLRLRHRRVDHRVDEAATPFTGLLCCPPSTSLEGDPMLKLTLSAISGLLLTLSLIASPAQARRRQRGSSAAGISLVGPAASS